MAENENILQRLGKLFQNSIVLRKTPSGQIKVKDVDFTQTALTSNFIDRYNRLMHGSGWQTKYAAAQNQSAYDVARKELFRDYELMDADPIISSALDIEPILMTQALGYEDNEQNEFYIYKDGEFLTATSNTEYIDNDVVHATQYCYQVTAVYDLGESGFSNTGRECRLWRCRW